MRKKHIGIISGGAASLLAVLILTYGSTHATVSGADEVTEATIENLEKQYGESLHHALFSLPEFRSLSIISFDKTSKSYDNQYRSPEFYVRMLNKPEKDKLLENAIKTIDRTEDFKSRNILCGKIKRWCRAEAMLGVLEEKYEISRDSLIKLFEKQKGSDAVLTEINKNDQTPEKADREFYSVVNYLAEQSNKTQMLYFSDLFKSLSNSIKD